VISYARLRASPAVRAFFGNPLFWGALVLKVALGSMLASHFLRDLFVPFLNYFVESGFANPWDHFAALDRLDSAAAAWERASAGIDGLAATGRRRAALATVNRMLAASEQALTDSAGLPRRPWFRHLVYAPGAYTGYGVKTIPGVREAIELRRPAEAQAEAARAAAALVRYADVVRRAADALAAALR